MVVMVVVVIRVVVVSSSVDMGFLAPVWLAAEELKAVVSSPGEMTVAVDSAWPRPGTACVGLVVVPAGVCRGGVFLVALAGLPKHCGFDACASVPAPAEDSPKYSLLRRAAWIRSPRG